MKRIIIVLTVAFAVFCGTLFFLNVYMTEKARNYAYNNNSLLLKNISDNFGHEIEASTDLVENYLSGILFLEDDSVDSNDCTSFYIKDRSIPKFPKTIKSYLLNFLRTNEEFTQVTFLVDDSVSLAYEDYGFYKGFALSASLENDTIMQLDYDFMHAKTYNRVKSELKSVWALPSHSSRMTGKIVNYYVPILCEDGSLFGTFVVNHDISSIRKEIEDHLLYGKEASQMWICDNEGEIIASYPEQYEKRGTINNLSENFKSGSLTESFDTIGSHIISTYNGERWLTSRDTIPGTDWLIYSANKEKAIYRDATQLLWIILTVTLLGMILMCACCWLIFKMIKKDFEKKAIAENEIQMAASVQSSLLSVPNFSNADADLKAFLRPAREAGGDLYGYAERDGHLFFCIGDVSGKGMPAALFMTQVLSLFRDATHHSFSPEEIAREINDVLAENNPTMMFCTYIVGVLKGNELTFCNAGHNQPVIIRKDKQPELLQMRPHTALGLMEGFPYKNESLILAPDDVLLLYTDGVTEAMNVNHEQFGESRLIDALSANNNNYIDSVLSKVESFVGNYEQSDDITILSITATSK